MILTYQKQSNFNPSHNISTRALKLLMIMMTISRWGDNLINQINLTSMENFGNSISKTKIRFIPLGLMSSTELDIHIEKRESSNIKL
jgi:hypothetical protein